MIVVKVRERSIEVFGHAGMAPKGQDIVCAAVSAVTLTLLNGLREIAKMKIRKEVRDGFVRIQWNEINAAGRVLIDTWYLGILEIARGREKWIKID